ncbi:hypothetical protein FSHL1_010403 [Fusarium sambucinum]
MYQPMEMDLPYREAPSIEDASVKDLLHDVFSSLSGEDVFAIGGHVQDFGKLAVQWTDKTNGQSHTLRFPLAASDASKNAFTQLLNAPATMDADDFFTNFNPYVHGILEAINQTLACSAYSTEIGAAVKAELCKLEVQSASSDRPETHVDSRSDRHMGTLMICLPVPHKGGQLAIRHEDHQHGDRLVEFDWASQHPDTIQWAAFMSHCEHKVLPITEGHRLMLTYNLIWTDCAPALMATQLEVLDQESLDFYAGLVKLLNKMRSTGKQYIVGFTCTHRYPHASRSSYEQTQFMLKGMDMMVYQALRRNVGKVRVRAVLDDSQYIKEERERERERVKEDGDFDPMYDSDLERMDDGELESLLKDSELELSELQRMEELPESPSSYCSSEEYDENPSEDSDEEALGEDLVCVEKNPRPVWATRWYQDWYRDNCQDHPDPVSVIGGFTREKVEWLNDAPNEKTPRELSVSITSVAERDTSSKEYDSALVILAWVGF